MINIFSVGITNAGESKVPCAYKDALSIYNTFEAIFSDSFSTYNSLCVADIKAKDFTQTLSVLINTLKSDDIFVLYFSGHGTIEDDSLELQFSDEGFPIDNLKSITKKCAGHIIIILDCCHSGGASKLAYRPSVFKSSNISVIASNSVARIAQFDENGSIFTRCLIAALQNMHINRNTITLNGIVNKIEQLGYDNCQVNVAEGKGDISLSPKSIDGFDSEMATQHVAKLSNSNFEYRELLWYTLQDYSYAISFSAIKKYFESRKTEASWLVRRAMGTQLGLLMDDSEVYQYCVDKFRSTQDWTVKAVCAIGLRYKIVGKEEVKNLFLASVADKNAPMDLVWLLTLYLADVASEDILNIVMKTKLSKTSWGKLEIIKCFKSLGNDTIRKYITYDDEVLCHLALANKNNCDIELYNEINESSLAMILYNAPARDRLKQNTKSKYLLSALFGNYRYSLQVDFNGYFTSTRKSQIINELTNAQRLPLVEMRMEIFKYFQVNQDQIDKFKDSIIWGLKDKHPWVRREALKALAPKHLDLCKKDLALDYSLDYPGQLDLLLEMIKFNIDVNNYLDDLTESELEAINQEIRIS